MKSNENAIDLRRFLRQAKKSIWVYICSLIFFGALAGYYIYRAMPQYVVEGAMLIEDSSEEASAVKSAGPLSAMMRTFSVGGFSTSSVDNEVHLAGSRDVMLRTVRALQLNRLYIGRGADGRRSVLYPSPVIVEAPDEFFDTLGVSFNVDITFASGKADIKISKGFIPHTVAEVNGTSLPAVVETPWGPLTVAYGDTTAAPLPERIKAVVCGNEAAAHRLYDEVSVEVNDKMADIVDLSMKYPSRKLGMAIVNTLMEQYISKRSDRRRQTAAEAIDYYNERIAAVAAELAQAEKLSADYRRAKGITAIEQEAEIMATAKLEGTMEAVKARSEIDYYTRVLETVRGRLGKNTLIPQIESFRDTSVALYNSLIENRVALEKSARPGNPALEKLNTRIAMLSASIGENASKVIDKARNDLDVKQRIVGTAGSRLSQYPEMEREYASLLRDSEFKNQLYLFLLQNRENAVLKLYANSNPAYIFEPAYTLPKPSPVKPALAALAALLLGLVMPSIWVILRMHRNDSISEPMDVAFLGLEERTIRISAEGKNINRLRSLLVTNPERRVIYLATPSETDRRFVDQLRHSFTDAGLTLNLTDDAKNNSDLLRQATAATAPEGYCLLRVPDSQELAEISSLLNRPEAELLVLLHNGLTDRRQLRTILRGMRTDKIILAIVRPN